MSATLAIIPPAQIAPGTTLFTPVQTAEYLRVQPQTLANWRITGRGPKFVRVGRLVRYRLADLESWIADNS